MKRFIFTGIIILFVMAGCGGDHSSTDGLITVDVNDSYSTKKELVLQDFMDVEYIPLETNDEFINRACVQAVGEKYIIVTNFYDDGNIFVYGRNGKAIRKINRKGQGGEEYVSMRSVSLDEENEEIFVNDFHAKKIRVYDLEGNFKRSLNQRSEKSSFYVEMLDYDKDNLICYDKFNFEVPFLLVSKQDGSITKEITVPYKEKQLFHIVERLYDKGETRAAGPGPYNSIIPFNGNWILFEASADTVYTLMPDYSLRPLIARTPPIHTMDPGVFVVLRLISDRYYFMETVKNVWDFGNDSGFPRTFFMYDRQDKSFYEYTVYNGDYSTSKEFYMNDLRHVNQEIESWRRIEAYQLVEANEKGELKGQLKEIAATLDEEANPVIMLIKHKKQ